MIPRDSLKIVFCNLHSQSAIFFCNRGFFLNRGFLIDNRGFFIEIYRREKIVDFSMKIVDFFNEKSLLDESVGLFLDNLS